MEKRYGPIKKGYDLMEVLKVDGEAKLISHDKENSLRVYSLRIPPVSVVVERKSSSGSLSYIVIGNEKNIALFEDACKKDIYRKREDTLERQGFVLITQRKNSKLIARLGIDSEDFFKHTNDANREKEKIIFSSYGNLDWPNSNYYSDLLKISGKSLKDKKIRGKLEKIIKEIREDVLD